MITPCHDEIKYILSTAYSKRTEFVLLSSYQLPCFLPRFKGSREPRIEL